MERDENNGFFKICTEHDASKSAQKVLDFAKDMLRISKMTMGALVLYSQTDADASAARLRTATTRDSLATTTRSLLSDWDMGSAAKRLRGAGPRFVRPAGWQDGNP
eukprot:gene21204-28111_t